MITGSGFLPLVAGAEVEGGGGTGSSAGGGGRGEETGAGGSRGVPVPVNRLPFSGSGVVRSRVGGLAVVVSPLLPLGGGDEAGGSWLPRSNELTKDVKPESWRDGACGCCGGSLFWGFAGAWGVGAAGSVALVLMARRACRGK